MVGAAPTSSDFISEVACLRLGSKNLNPARPDSCTVCTPWEGFMVSKINLETSSLSTDCFFRKANGI